MKKLNAADKHGHERKLTEFFGEAGGFFKRVKIKDGHVLQVIQRQPHYETVRRAVGGNVHFHAGRGELDIYGPTEESTEKAAQIVRQMQNKIMQSDNHDLTKDDLEKIIHRIIPAQAPADIKASAGGFPLTPLNKTQADLIQAMGHSDLVFAVGPAGTGKTYVAVAKAVQMYNSKAVSKIILTRPVVEAGEKLGFLPGTFNEKMDPYMRPLYDALHELMGAEKVKKLIEKGDIEIAPLAFMRGRTLKNAFIILDEAQNTTNEQMKMFVTRKGKGSSVVVTGDPSQCDLPRGRDGSAPQSGLNDILDVLKYTDNVPVITFSADEVVRDPTVAKLVSAYEKRDQIRYKDQTPKPTPRP